MKMLDQSTVTVLIYDITIDSHINTRELDEDVIEEYRESMREYGESDWQNFWNEAPRMTESGHLYSGFHTVTAAMREFGREYQIDVIKEGKDWREAYFRATRMNATHGRRRTNAEKELAVRRWLEDEEMRQWTDGHIAKECLVSAPFVSKLAKSKSLETISSRPTTRKFVDSDGEIQWQETKKIGTNQPTAYNPKAQLETEKNGCIRAQNGAYDKWHGICGEKAIPFDWDQFVAVASKEMGELSLPNNDDTTPELVAEKSRSWHKLKDAISHQKAWVKSHINDLEIAAKHRRAEADERVEASRAATKAMEDAKASFHEHQDALGLKNVSWQQLEERATLEFKRSWAETLFQPVVSPEGKSEHSAAKLSYVASLWVKLKKLTVPPAHGWVKIYAEEIQAKKAAFHALTQMQSKVQAAYQEHLQPHTVYWDAFNEALAANIDSKLAEPVWGGMPVEELEQYTDLYGRVLEAITEDAEWVQALKAAALAKSESEKAKDIQQEKREALVKEVDELHDAPNGIYGLFPSVDPDSHIAREQFLKTNYDAYSTYCWRDRLKIEALEKLRDTLMQIKQDITEKGVDWFMTADPPEPEQPTALQIEPLGPSDSTHEAESEPINAKSFEELGSPTKADIRLIASCSNTLLLRDDAPETLKIAASDMLNAVKAFVGTAAETDEDLKHALSTETSASIVKGVT